MINIDDARHQYTGTCELLADYLVDHLDELDSGVNSSEWDLLRHLVAMVERTRGRVDQAASDRAVATPTGR